MPPPPPPDGGPFALDAGFQQPGYQQGYGYGVGPVQVKTNGLAVAALVCGIVGLIIFSIVLGPLAVIFGIRGRRQIDASGGAQKGRGMATAGIVLGIVAVVLWIIVVSSGSGTLR
jgi:Domain of unknown function (DUF4190)